MVRMKLTMNITLNHERELMRIPNIMKDSAGTNENSCDKTLL